MKLILTPLGVSLTHQHGAGLALAYRLPLTRHDVALLLLLVIHHSHILRLQLFLFFRSRRLIRIHHMIALKSVHHNGKST